MIMRKWVAGLLVLTGAMALVSGDVDAQQKKKPHGKPATTQPAPPPAAAPKAAPAPPPAAAPKKAERRDIELDEGAAAGPVTAGQMTEEAATAKRLFDGERWSEAALGLYRVYKGETGDDKTQQRSNETKGAHRHPLPVRTRPQVEAFARTRQGRRQCAGQVRT